MSASWSASWRRPAYPRSGRTPPQLGWYAASSSAGTRSVVKGPFARGDELPAAFSIIRVGSLEEAAEWASRQAGALGDVEVDIRPVTEPWDIGLAPRPADIDTRRYMVLRKATAETESGAEPSSAQRSALTRVVEETTITACTSWLRRCAQLEGQAVQELPRRRHRVRRSVHRVQRADRRLRHRVGGSSRGRRRWAALYIDVVEADEVDVRELV